MSDFLVGLVGGLAIGAVFAFWRPRPGPTRKEVEEDQARWAASEYQRQQERDDRGGG